MDQTPQDFGARLRSTLKPLRDHKWIVIACIVLATAAAYAYGATRPKVYQSEAQLLLQQGDLAGTVVGLNDYQAQDPEREVATALTLAEQPVIAGRVAAELDGDLTSDDIAGKVTATAAGNSQVITISAQDGEAERAAQLANLYATQYVDFREETAQASIRRALQGLDTEIESAESLGEDDEVEELQNQRRRLQSYGRLQQGGAELFQRAEVNETAISPNPTRNAMLGFVLGAILGVGLAFLRDRLDSRLRREEDVSEILPGVPTIATIPSWRRGGGEMALQTEGFRALQTTLSFLDADGTIRSVLVTSATVGEGKTTTSLNLALAIAEREESVLVLEGDLRQRGTTRRLGLDDRPGVAEILKGQGDIEDFRVRVALDDRRATGLRAEHRRGPVTAPALTGTVDVVPAGQDTTNPHRLLTSDRLRHLLADATGAADKVIVDGTPLGMISDMLPVAGRIDAVIVVVHLYHTRRNELKRLAHQLQQAGIHPFGLVVFGVETDRAYDTYIRGRRPASVRS